MAGWIVSLAIRSLRLRVIPSFTIGRTKTRNNKIAKVRIIADNSIPSSNQPKSVNHHSRSPDSKPSSVIGPETSDGEIASLSKTRRYLVISGPSVATVTIKGSSFGSISVGPTVPNRATKVVSNTINSISPFSAQPRPSWKWQQPTLTLDYPFSFYLVCKTASRPSSLEDVALTHLLIVFSSISRL